MDLIWEENKKGCKTRVGIFNKGVREDIRVRFHNNRGFLMSKESSFDIFH